HHGACPLPAVPLQLSNDSRFAGAVRSGAGACRADPQAAGPGHGVPLRADVVHHAVRGRARIKHLLMIALLGVAMVPVLWLSGGPPDGPNLPVLRHLPTLVKPYQRQRVNAMFRHDPKTMRESAYQTQRAITAFASGGITG